MYETGVLVAPKVDELAFELYLPLRQQERTDQLDPSIERLAQLREQFEASGQSANPDLRPDCLDQGIDMLELIDSRDRLIAIQHELPELIPDDPNGAARLAYGFRIRQDLGYIGIVDAAVRGDAALFRELNAFTDGPIDHMVYLAVCDWFATEAMLALKKAGPLPDEIKEAAHTVLDAFGKSNGMRRNLIPSAKVFNGAQERAQAKGGYLQRVLDNAVPPESQHTITAPIGDDYQKRMSVNVGGQPVIHDGRYWEIRPSGIYRPKDYRLSRQDFIEFNVHEMKHLEEMALAQLLGNILLVSTGFDRHIQGNEGEAVVPEQLVNPTFRDFAKEHRWHELLGRDLTASLANGMADGGRNLSFVETYRLVKSAYLVYEAMRSDAGDLTDAENLQKVIDNANDQAWDLTTIVYAGTDGSGEMGGSRRPAHYLQGNVDAWNAEAREPGFLEKHRAGKYVKRFGRHIELLGSLGVLPH